MSGLCIAAGAEMLALAVSTFTLSWTHSVEHVRWEEDWRVTPAGLEIVAARIQGTGAGMEPPEGARREGPWWSYVPGIPPLPELVLGASGATAAWSLCAEGTCHALGEGSGAPIVLRPCAAQRTDG